MKTLKYSIGLLAAMFVFIAGFYFWPITTVYEDDCKVITGEMIKIKTSENNDIVIKLKENPENVFYINRGTEQGLSSEILKADLMNQTIEIWYVNHPNLLKLNDIPLHISRLKHGDKVIFDEIRMN